MKPAIQGFLPGSPGRILVHRRRRQLQGLTISVLLVVATMLMLLLVREQQPTPDSTAATTPLQAPGQQGVARLRTEAIRVAEDFPRRIAKLLRTNRYDPFQGIFTPDAYPIKGNDFLLEDRRKEHVYEEADRYAASIKIVKINRTFAKVALKQRVRNRVVRDNRTNRVVERIKNETMNATIYLLRIEGRWLIAGFSGRIF